MCKGRGGGASRGGGTDPGMSKFLYRDVDRNRSTTGCHVDIILLSNDSDLIFATVIVKTHLEALLERYVASTRERGKRIKSCCLI